MKCKPSTSDCSHPYLLPDGFLGGREELEETRQGSTVDDDLGLDVITGHDVPHGPEGGADDRLLVVHQELHYSPADAAVYDGLDLVVGSVTQVGQSPAGVGQHVRVVVEEEPAEDRQGWGHLETQINNDQLTREHSGKSIISC